MRIGKSNTNLKEYSLKPGIPSMEYSTAEKDVGVTCVSLSRDSIAGLHILNMVMLNWCIIT
jgi:hypothetical protein